MAEELARLRWRQFGCPKRGNSVAESEDAAAAHAGLGRFAVADGATESAFAGDWSKLLAESFVQTPLAQGGWSAWLPAVQQRWLAAIGNREMPWFLEDKFEQGAFAAFLGVGLSKRGEVWDWQAVAVGDCCLFHVRADALVKKFPILRSIDFDGSPDLLGSRQREVTRDFWSAGELRPGDRLLCMSDALAQWFLAQVEAGRMPWRAVAQIEGDANGEQAFAAWIAQLREGKVLRNDDVTLLTIEMG